MHDIFEVSSSLRDKHVVSLRRCPNKNFAMGFFSGSLPGVSPVSPHMDHVNLNHTTIVLGIFVGTFPNNSTNQSKASGWWFQPTPLIMPWLIYG